MASLDRAPECLPLKTYDAVMAWSRKLADLSFTAASVPIATHAKLASDRPRTIVCHDMRGGYLQDRYTQGSSDDSAYRCIYWQHIDTFIYFSHHFVTIPPPCWTNAAHRHHVFMLGTVITEWDEGKANCAAVLRSEDTYKAFADQLVLLTKCYGFDGWLINIENPVEEEKVELLLGFLGYLTSQMHAAVPHSQVLWYDSVTHTGQLKWQDELNDNNQRYFDCTDGIFLNYGWKDETLSQSAARALSHGRKYDVYVGVDVFGRGCYGGGGFNTCQALAKIGEHDLSAAIFAPGWVHEKTPEDFTRQEYKFWSLVVPYLHSRPVRTLPLATSFCQGQGPQLYHCGQVLSDKPWTNLSLQDTQPLLCDDVTALCVDATEAWQGGACLALSANFNQSSQSKHFRLLEVDAELPSTVLVSYVYKLPANTQLTLTLTVLTADAKKVTYRLGAGNHGDSGDTVVMEELSRDAVPAVCEHLHSDQHGWAARSYQVAGVGGYKLKQVSATLSAIESATVSQEESRTDTAKLGYLQICDIKVPTVLKPIALEVTSSLIEQSDDLPNLVDLSCDLTWSCDQPSSQDSQDSGDAPQCDVTGAQTFHVFYTCLAKQDGDAGEHSFLGSVVGPCVEQSLLKYRVCRLLVDMESAKYLRFIVQPVNVLGHAEQITKCPFVDMPISIH